MWNCQDLSVVFSTKKLGAYIFTFQQIHLGSFKNLSLATLPGVFREF